MDIYAIYKIYKHERWNIFDPKNRYAGTGREYNLMSAIHVEGVPPIMESISILHSAYTGINVTSPDAPVVINNCTMQYNRGKKHYNRGKKHYLVFLIYYIIYLVKDKKVSLLCPRRVYKAVLIGAFPNLYNIFSYNFSWPYILQESFFSLSLSSLTSSPSSPFSYSP